MEIARERLPLSELARHDWDMLVIGGGITGAGVFHEAARLGLRVLLVERGDFASGTSSNSAKLIHGGLHYLARLHLGLARESIRERDQLLVDRAGLIEPLDFVLPLPAGERLQTCVSTVGLGVYQAIGGKRHRPRHVREGELASIAPGISNRYQDALRYTEGTTDDARLTLRVIAEGRREGGIARNYTSARSLTRDRHGDVIGGLLLDEVSGATVAVRAQCVVNAAGPWTDDVRAWIGQPAGQRLVKGSHLVFAHDRFPIATAMAFYHPESGRPLYIVPWNGVTIVGTTHIDSGSSVESPARATWAETCHLLEGAQSMFPGLRLTFDDLQATYSGYRPIVDTRTSDPSRASRDRGIWVENGLITVTGGKLTTYRAMAKQVMRKVTPRIGKWVLYRAQEQKFGRLGTDLAEVMRKRPELHRFAVTRGTAAAIAMIGTEPEEWLPLPGSCGVTITEIRWAARAEDVVRLDDLLFRRVRMGLLSANGGGALFDRIEPVVRHELGWDRPRWLDELGRYRELWNELYAVPGRSALTDPISIESEDSFEMESRLAGAGSPT